MTLSTLNKISYLVAALMILASIYYRSFNITLSVTLGAVIVTLSFRLLCWLVASSFKEGRKWNLIIIAFLKLILLGGILWLVVVKLPVNSIAFLAGLSTMVAAVIIYGLMGLIKGKFT